MTQFYGLSLADLCHKVWDWSVIRGNVFSFKYEDYELYELYDYMNYRQLQKFARKSFFFMTVFFWFLRFKSISKSQIYLFVKKSIIKKLKKYNARPVTMRL